ncbi:MAG TPA: hypothetical protein VHG09_06140 [Longimicrobiales bacterium]|nr:hypothetical protein [Longimicrobiales bacterium]
MTRRRMLLLAAALLLGGCGYFNSLYNANRSFATAERASRTGDRVTAAREYRDAIERAAVSYRNHPDSRWADDALLLLGRARFALDEHDATAAAMRTLLRQSGDPGMRATAHAYLGASLFMLDDARTALAHLDSAATALPAGSEEAAFASLWRARAGFDQTRSDAAWADLSAALSHDRIAHEAALEGVRRGFQQRDSARTFEFMRHLAATRHDGRTLARVDSLLTTISVDWSPSIAFAASAPLAQAGWPAEMRDQIALSRARLAIDAGDAASALDLAMQVANAVNLGAGSRARLLAAEIRLARAASVGELDEISDLLLAAYDNRQALDLLRRVHAARILLNQGHDPARSISLFAAAEFLRDELRAPRLARSVFIDFARRQTESVWAGKAALAAHQLEQTDETVALLGALADNPYARAARGATHDAAAIDRAEERLAFGIDGLRESAIAEAISRDVVVGRAVTVLDSTRTAARNDSVRIACGMLIDSLSIAGIRADSTRTACLRGDTARVRFVLDADTMILRDTVVADPGVPLPGTTRPDTTGADTIALHRLLLR